MTHSMTLFVVSKAARTRVRTGVRIQQIRVPPFNPRVRFRPGDGRRPSASLMGSIPLASLGVTALYLYMYDVRVDATPCAPTLTPTHLHIYQIKTL